MIGGLHFTDEQTGVCVFSKNLLEDFISNKHLLYFRLLGATSGTHKGSIFKTST
jgi:hypothetical protein